MVMGERGMADMSEMEMPLPENTIPMMTGQGPYGSVEMGGMFSVLKVREDQAPNDYSDPGWYQQPLGSQASPVDEPSPEAIRTDRAGKSLMSGSQDLNEAIEVQIRKPGKHDHS